MICYVEAKNIKEAIKLVLEENTNINSSPFNVKARKGYKVYRIKLIPPVQLDAVQDRYIR